jgi:drug/metabolite transporter (DMT)-like permease
MPWWFTLSLAVIALCGVALIIWRKEATNFQAMSFGARLHPGCAVVQGVLLLLVALVFLLLVQLR